MLARWIAVVCALTLVAGCSLDLDRLRAGAGTDGGERDDAGERADAGGGLDAAAPDAEVLDGGGGCGCVGGSFQPIRFLVGGTGVSHVSLADLDGDDDLDLVVSRRGAPPALLRMAVEGCGQNDLVLAESPETLSDAVADTIVALADWNRDGVLDIIAPAPSPGTSRALLGNVASGRYSASSTAAIPTMDAHAAFAFDLDGVGGPDDVVLLSGAMGVILVLGSDRETPLGLMLDSMGVRAAFATPTAAGAIGAIARGPAGIDLVRFTTAAEPPLEIVATLVADPGSNIVDVHFADVDGDGNEDLVAVDVGGGNLVIHRGSEEGEFANVSHHPISPLAVTTARGLGDGASVELIVVDRDSVDVRRYDGVTLADPSDSITIGEPSAIAVGDVDEDGTADLVIGQTVSGMGHVTVYRRICF